MRTLYLLEQPEYLIESVGYNSRNFVLHIFHNLRRYSDIWFFALHAHPDQIANRHNN